MTINNFSLQSAQFDYAVNTGGSTGISMVHSGSANVKGAWTDLITSTRINANWIKIAVGASSIADEYLIDIALGASSSETVVIANLLVAEVSVPNVACHDFPLVIPKGTRISARQQNNTTANIVRVWAYPYNGPTIFGCHSITTYGAASSGTTGGTQVDPGGTVNTKGSWSQITSGTSTNHSLLWVYLGGQNNTVRTSANYLIDIGVGSAGNEVVIIPNLRFTANSASDSIDPTAFGPFYVSVPSGTRIAARSQCSINDATDRLFDVVVYGA